MTRFWSAAIGFLFVSTAQAAQPPSSCQGLLSDPEVYSKVKDAVVYAAVVFNKHDPSDKIFSDLAHWLEGEVFLPPQLYTRLQKIRSEMDSAQMREQIRACYPTVDELLHPETAKQAEAARRAEAAKQAEAAEAAKREEPAKQAEEAARQAWEAGAPARAKQAEAARQAWEAEAPARAAEAAKQAEAARQAWEAEAPARAAEAAKQAEAMRQAEEAAREAAAENKLKGAYADYMVVKRCYDEGEGLTAYISKPQLAEAQAAVSAIEQKIKNSNIDLDALRKQANTLADYQFIELSSMPEAWPGHPPVEILCNEAFGELMQTYVPPEEAGTKTDF